MMENGKLYTHVMENLMLEPMLDASNITVAVKDNSVVVLGGTVYTHAEKKIAEETLEKINDVRAVANELRVELASTYERNDADIAQEALTAIKWTMFIPSEEIKVSVDHGHLTLIGEVLFQHHRDRVQKAVNEVSGITCVTNNIRVKPNVKTEDVKNKIVAEFERHSRVDAQNIDVEVEGSKVTLKGKVRDFDEAREARDAAWSVPGVVSVVDLLLIGKAL